MSKPTGPPRSALLTAELRWYLRHADETPVEISRQTGIHHSALYRFAADTRGLSHDATDKLAEYLKLRLVQDRR